VAVVEVGGNLLRLGGRERAGADGVAPAAVADSSTDKVDLRAHRVFVDLLDHHGDVDASVRLAGDVELVGLVLRESVEEVRQELVGVLGGRLVGVDALAGLGGTLAVREANTFRGLQVQDVREVAPTVGVQEQLRDSINLVGKRVVVGYNLPIFRQQTDERGRPGSTVQPQNDRVRRGVFGGLNQPVVELSFNSRQGTGRNIWQKIMTITSASYRV
jgi:hypothetical protein